jgi:thiamine transporter ThiT
VTTNAVYSLAIAAVLCVLIVCVAVVVIAVLNRHRPKGPWD